jgi:hypothetical protein
MFIKDKTKEIMKKILLAALCVMNMASAFCALPAAEQNESFCSKVKQKCCFVAKKSATVAVNVCGAVASGVPFWYAASYCESQGATPETVKTLRDAGSVSAGIALGLMLSRAIAAGCKHERQRRAQANDQMHRD